MRSSNMVGAQVPVTDTPRSIERMVKGDFLLLLDRMAKKNNTMGMVMSCSIENRMIPDDTDIGPAIVHWTIFHSINGNTDEMARMMKSIRFKYERAMNTSLPNKEMKIDLTILSSDAGRSVADIFVEKDQVHAALGITDERRAELDKLMDKTLKEESTITRTLEKVSKDCLHVNEIAWCSFVIGQLVNMNRVITSL